MTILRVYKGRDKIGSPPMAYTLDRCTECNRLLSQAVSGSNKVDEEMFCDECYEELFGGTLDSRQVWNKVSTRKRGFSMKELKGSYIV